MRFREIPAPMPGMRAWVEHADGYSFVITYEDGTNLRAGADREAWVGYTASMRALPNTPRGNAVRIDGLWQSFAGAEKACRDALKQLRQKQ